MADYKVEKSKRNEFWLEKVWERFQFRNHSKLTMQAKFDSQLKEKLIRILKEKLTIIQLLKLKKDYLLDVAHFKSVVKNGNF